MNQQARMGRVRLTALVVVGSLLGALVLTPGVSLAAKFLTKKKADKRYLNTTEVLVAGSTDDSFDDNFTSPTFTPVISTPITAPTDGFLLIVGEVSAGTYGGGIDVLALRLRLDSTAVTTEDNNQGFGASDPVAAANGLAATIPVTKGAHTIHVDARVGTGDVLTVGTRSLSVLFVPKGSGVTIPA